MNAENLIPDMQFLFDWKNLIAAGVVVIVAFAVVMFVMARRSKSKKMLGLARPIPDLDIKTLGQHGPTPNSVRFEFYHTPVRLAAVVIAPVGKGRSTPSDGELEQLLDFIMPGLRDVAASHGPAVRAWPAQLSVQGFKQSFFNNLQLPGERGKGSPWCSLAGKFAAHGHGFVAGIVCRAVDANNLGQVMVEFETQWLDILRIRS